MLWLADLSGSEILHTSPLMVSDTGLEAPKIDEQLPHTGATYLRKIALNHKGSLHPYQKCKGKDMLSFMVGIFLEDCVFRWKDCSIFHKKVAGHRWSLLYQEIDSTVCVVKEVDLTEGNL